CLLGRGVARRAPEALFVRRRRLGLAERGEQELRHGLAELSLEPRAGRSAVVLDRAADRGAVPEQALTASGGRCGGTSHRPGTLADRARTLLGRGSLFAEFF